MPVAIKLTDISVEWIIRRFAEVELMDLSHLRDEMEYNAEYGNDTYLIVDGSISLNNVTATTFIDADFHNTWKFIEPESEHHWSGVTRV
jgi:hypothetical protein